MVKSELAKRIFDQNPHLLYQRDAENVVDAILGEIVVALARGGRVELRGFGNFSVRQWKSRIARNPRTGVAVVVKKKAHPFFKAGKEMRARLNRSSV
jgi:integration host factor subunit beta